MTSPSEPNALEVELFALRRDEAVRFLMPLFFVSGATGLVWQTVWARELHLVFGTSTFAIATVLSAFMAGLAIGGAVAGAYADRVKNPVVAYGLLEIGIGVYAGAFPFIVHALTPVYLGAARAMGPDPIKFGVVQGLLVGSALLIPTAFMGATLPLLARFATDRLGAAGDRVARLYAVNTAGALVGTAVCGFFLLPYFGKAITTWMAAGANVTLGVAALLLAASTQGAERAGATMDVPVEPLGTRGIRVALAMALAGFASLVYEVAWTRLLVLTCGASVYAFTVMLLAFLAGIAGGGRLGGPVADYVYARWGARGVMLALAATEIAVGALAYAFLWVYPLVPIAYVNLFDVLGAGSESAFVYVASLGVSGLVMTPPALLMGFAFPLAVRAVTTDDKALASPVGRIYSANTLGAVFGAALAGFVLLPNLWVRATVMLGAFVNLLAAFTLLVDRDRTPRVRLALIGAAVAMLPLVSGVLVKPPWNPLWMTAGLYKYAPDLTDHSYASLYRVSVEKFDLLYYAEGLSSVVTVARNQTTGNIWLANNGKIDASTSADMPTQVLVALLPFQYVETAEDVMVIGLASGITAGAAASVPDVKHLDVVELEPAIIGAAKIYAEHNHHVLDDPRVRVIPNDGRNQILLSAPGSYDIVISEPSNPWLTGVSNLFTREFLDLGRTRLKPGGVWAQWVQMYGMGEGDLKSLLATFASVYPHVLVFTTIDDADLVILGSEAPLYPDRGKAAALLTRGAGVHDELERAKLHNDLDLLATWVMDKQGIARFAKDEPINTDDNLRIEYSAPLHLYARTSSDNMESLLAKGDVPRAAVGDDPLALIGLARRYLAKDDFDRSMIAAVAASEVLARQDPDPAVRALGDRAENARKDDWRGAVTVIDQIIAATQARPDPPVDLIGELLAWRDDLDAWAKN